MSEPLTLTEIRMRADEPLPRHRRTAIHNDRDWLLGYVDGLQLDLRQTREAKAGALTANHICRDHHALYHGECTEGAV